MRHSRSPARSERSAAGDDPVPGLLKARNVVVPPKAAATESWKNRSGSASVAIRVCVWTSTAPGSTSSPDASTTSTAPPEASDPSSSSTASITPPRTATSALREPLAVTTVPPRTTRSIPIGGYSRGRTPASPVLSSMKSIPGRGQPGPPPGMAGSLGARLGLVGSKSSRPRRASRMARTASRIGPPMTIARMTNLPCQGTSSIRIGWAPSQRPAGRPRAGDRPSRRRARSWRSDSRRAARPWMTSYRRRTGRRSRTR